MPVHSRNAKSVVSRRADNSSDMGPMPMIVHGIRIPVDRINTIAVVNLSITVVIQPISIAVGLISKHVPRKVRVRVVDAGIDHRDYHPDTARNHIPRFRRVNVGVGHASALPDVVQRPLLTE